MDDRGGVTENIRNSHDFSRVVFVDREGDIVIDVLAVRRQFPTVAVIALQRLADFSPRRDVLAHQRIGARIEQDHARSRYQANLRLDLWTVDLRSEGHTPEL